MEQKTLTGYGRTSTRKTANKRLRKEGMIPAVIYGHNEPVTISVEAREFDKKFHTVSENTIISINVEKGNSYDVLVKDYQENMLKGAITHIDFYEIERGKTLRTHVPVHLEGSAPGAKEGGIVEQSLHELEIECLPKDIPEEFTLDISALDIGDSLRVSDIPTEEGVKILTDQEYTVVVITTAKIVVEETDEEEEGELAEGEEAVEEGDEAEEEADE